MRIAIVHDWLVTYAGAERALEQILLLYPEADLYSLVDFIPLQNRSFLLMKKVHTSFIQRLPYAKEQYRRYLPLMPFAIEQFDLSRYDLIISSSHAVAKGVRTHQRQMHICYCYTPIRYAWDMQEQYLQESGLNRGLKGLAVRLILHYIRKWDIRTSKRVNHYVAISQYIADRILKIYGRKAAIIYPPVDLETFVPSSTKDSFYMTASRMVPYKKIGLIVEAFSKMTDKRLVVIGDGPDFEKIRMKAGKNIELLGYQPTDVLKEYMQKAKAFVYAAEEDFGIVTVEAQSCGTPIIAYGKGGSLETVLDGKTGIFFYEQTVQSIQDAVMRFERNQEQYTVQGMREHVKKFSRERFRQEFKVFVDEMLSHKVMDCVFIPNGIEIRRES